MSWKCPFKPMFGLHNCGLYIVYHSAFVHWVVQSILWYTEVFTTKIFCLSVLSAVEQGRSMSLFKYKLSGTYLKCMYLK